MRLKQLGIAVVLVALLSSVASATPVIDEDNNMVQKTMPVFVDIPSSLFIMTTELGSGVNGPQVDQMELVSDEGNLGSSFTGGFDWIVRSNDACVREISWSDFYGVDGGAAAGAIISSDKLQVKAQGRLLISNPATVTACSTRGELIESVALALPWQWSMVPGAYVGSVTLMVRQV